MDRFKNFTVLISRISRSIRRIKTEEMKGYNLKSPHVSCIYYLYKEEALTSKELTDICDEDKAAVSRTLEYLETNGYIYCESSLKKRYRSEFKLTEKGKEVGVFISKKIDAILAKASEGLSEENRTILYQSLSLICNNLQKITKEKKND